MPLYACLSIGGIVGFRLAINYYQANQIGHELNMMRTDAQGKPVINVYPNRKMYEDEFNAIGDYQKMHYPNILTDERKKRFRDFDIFYQRPFNYSI